MVDAKEKELELLQVKMEQGIAIKDAEISKLQSSHEILMEAFEKRVVTLTGHERAQQNLQAQVTNL
jgi:hypothetical protein